MASSHDQLASAFKAGLQHSVVGSDINTKAEVNYREADPSSTDSCGVCTHFNNNKCDIVAGKIDPAYVCDKFEASPAQVDTSSGDGTTPTGTDITGG